MPLPQFSGPWSAVTRSQRIPFTSRLATLTCLVWLSVTEAVDIDNEVTVWIEQGQAVATSLVSGRREIPLDVQERVTGSGASGINAVVVTLRQLLGFYSHTLARSKTDPVRQDPYHLLCLS